MLRRPLVITLAVAPLLVAAAATPAEATSTSTTRYRSCKELNRDYPAGVGRKGAVDKSGGRVKSNPVRNFRVDNRLYDSLPKTLDRDRDGIACEKHTDGPSSPSRPTPTPSKPKPSTPRPALYTVKGKVITTREATPGFVTPSGNINCAIYDALHCEIKEHTYRIPPRPSWCDLDWAVSFDLNRRATPACVGDTIWGSATVTRTQNTWFAATRMKPLRINGSSNAVLPYGWTLRQRGFSCTSQTSGVTCTNLNTKHGFTLSKKAYRIF